MLAEVEVPFILCRKFCGALVEGLGHVRDRSHCTMAVAGILCAVTRLVYHSNHCNILAHRVFCTAVRDGVGLREEQTQQCLVILMS